MIRQSGYRFAEYDLKDGAGRSETIPLEIVSARERSDNAAGQPTNRGFGSAGRYCESPLTKLSTVGSIRRTIISTPCAVG
jgi:hypothetical protein